MSRTLSYFAAFIGALCVYFIVHLFFSTRVRTVRGDVIQGFLIGFGLAFALAQAYARIKAVQVNGWITMFGLGKPGNGMFLRAAHAQLFPGPVNVPGAGYAATLRAWQAMLGLPCLANACSAVDMRGPANS